MLGHESLDTTQIYTQVGIAKLAAVHAATHPGAMLKREDLLADLLGESDNDSDAYRRGTAGGAGAENALSCEDDDDADHF
jgi:hypothetical protein